MDVVRTKRKGMPRGVLATALACVVLGVAFYAVFTLAHSGTTGPLVDRATLVTDQVQRETLERSVSAAGAFQSDEVDVVAATQPGVIDQILVRPGASVSNGTTVAVLSNPDLTAAVIRARAAVDVAEAQLSSAQQESKASALIQQSGYVSAKAQSEQDSETHQSLAKLSKSGYVPDQMVRIAGIKDRQSRSLLIVAQSQIVVDSADQQAKLSQARAVLDGARGDLQAKEAEVAALVIRTRVSGIVQSVAVFPGSRIDAGAELARVADQRNLKAVLQVPEGEVHSVTVGMPVRVDAGNGKTLGHVTRIAPSAQNGSVAVDVSFAHALPLGARPDLNVDGTIMLATMPHVISVARPAGAADNASVGIYRINPTTNEANLLQVRLGQGSADRVQVVSGLEPGDSVIVSDTSAYGGVPTLHLR